MNRTKCFFIEPVDPNDDHSSSLFRRCDTGETDFAHNFRSIAGCMWYADWYCDGDDGVSDVMHASEDGHVLVVNVFDYPWIVEGFANNCTRRGERHHCWVRHGDVRNADTVTVDKNGNTCSAGAGSLLIPGWHGFLRNGYLEEC